VSTQYLYDLADWSAIATGLLDDGGHHNLTIDGTARAFRRNQNVLI
jgi:hypothetical protein